MTRFAYLRPRRRLANRPPESHVAGVGTSPKTPQHRTHPDPVSEHEKEALPMPHERDEALGHTEAKPREVMKQAHQDLEDGQVDTDMRATPGLDAERRKKIVGRDK